MEFLAAVNIGDRFRSPFGKSLGLADFVSLVLSNAIALAAILLLVLIIAGGVMMIAGAGSGNKDEVAKGKKAVTAAITGFILIFVSYWIIVLLEDILNINILYPIV